MNDIDLALAAFIEYVNGGLYPPHATCLLFQNGLLAATILGDFAIWGAYFLIPWSLMVAHQRIGARLPKEGRTALVLFSCFIFLCGLTHLSALVNVFTGNYWIHAVILALTAVVSLVTAVWVMWHATPLYRAALRLVEAAEMGAVQVEPASVRVGAGGHDQEPISPIPNRSS